MFALFCGGKFPKRLACERITLNFSANLFEIKVIQNVAGALDSIGFTFGPVTVSWSLHAVTRNIHTAKYGDATMLRKRWWWLECSWQPTVRLTSTNGCAFARHFCSLQELASIRVGWD